MPPPPPPGPTVEARGALGAGGTVGTATASGATAGDPLQASVTSPVAGEIADLERSTSTAAPTGYALGGREVAVTAPPASVTAPLRSRWRCTRPR